MIILGIAAATVASFIASAILYALPPVSAQIARTSTARPGLPMVVQMASVLVRSLIAACLIAGLMAAAPWHGAISGLVLGLALAAIPAILLMGAVVHENVPVPTAALHLFDWVMKFAIIGALVGAFS